MLTAPGLVGGCDPEGPSPNAVGVEGGGILHPTEALVESWVSFLSQWQWRLFCTFTFRSPAVEGVKSPACDYVHPEAAHKKFTFWISAANRELWGGRFYKHPERGLKWARATELQRRGVLHFHALVGGLRVDELRRLSLMDLWNDIAGYARIEAPDSDLAVRRYCAKYVMKAGEVDLGGPLGLAPGRPVGTVRAFLGGGKVRLRGMGYATTTEAMRGELGRETLDAREVEIAGCVAHDRARRWDRPIGVLGRHSER